MPVTSIRLSYHRPVESPHLYRLSPESDPEDGQRKPSRSGPQTAGREDLPYRVELWDETAI